MTLQHLYTNPLAESQRLEIRTINRETNQVHSEFFEGISVAQDYSETLSLKDRTDVYFGCGLRDTHQSGKKDHTILWPFLWVDIDSKTPQLLQNFPLPPTLTVDSGNGIHAYWMLDVPLTSTEEVDTLLRGLAICFPDGDKGAAEAARILRVPNTYNYKSSIPKPVQIVESHQDHIYTSQDFHTAINHYAKIPFSEMLQTPKKGQRSEHEYHTLKDLRSVGFSEQAAYAMLMYYPFGEKAQSRKDAYAQNTIEKIYSEPITLTLTPTVFPAQKLMFCPQKKKISKLNKDLLPVEDLADFLLSVTALEESKADGLRYVVKFTTTDQEIESILESSHTSDHRKFTKLCNSKGLFFTGTPKDLQNIMFISLRAHKEEGVKHVHIANELGLTYHNNQKCLVTKYKTHPAGIEVRYDSPTKETMSDIIYSPSAKPPPTDTIKLLAEVHSPMLLGWFSAVATKAVLNKFGYSLPHMLLYGSRGSGKTTLIKHMQRLYYTQSPSTPATSTRFASTVFLGTYTSTPVNFTEFRENSFKTDADKAAFLEKLRHVYDQTNEHRGRQDLSIVTSKLISPVVMDGEHSISDSAVSERTMMLRVSHNKTAAQREANAQLPLKDVSSLGSAILTKILESPDEQIIEEFLQIKSQVESIFSKINSRLQQNLSCCIFGLNILNGVMGKIVFPMDTDSIIDYAMQWIEDSDLSVEGKQKGQEVDEFVRWICDEIILEKTNLNRFKETPFHYRVDYKVGTVSIHLATAYEAWYVSHKELGITKSTIRHQLKDRLGEYVLELSKNVVSTRGQTQRMYVLDGQKLNTTLGISLS